MAHRQFGTVPVELMATHVLSVTSGTDWPVQRVAMEALIRRQRFGKRDDLRVVEQPRGSSGLGVYRTGRKRQRGRPYATRLISVDPIGTTCDCADFVRSALGICKHGLVVMQHLFAKPRKLERARLAQSAPGHAHLGWDPIRPMTGADDWLERVVWRDGPAPLGRPSKALAAILRQLEPGPGQARTLARTHADSPAARLRLVEELIAFVEPVVKRQNGGPAQADAVLMRLLSVERVRLRERLACSGSVKRLTARPKGLKRSLYPYQREGLRRFLECGRLLLADDMGLGKTIQAIAACHVLYRTQRVRRGLILVPASLKAQWLGEWQQWSDVPVRVVDGSAVERAAIYRGCKRGFLIMNYEQLLRDFPYVDTFDPQLVVLDEAQRIKNWATKTAQFVKQLRPAYRLVLTGTPMENRIDELASIVEWVDELALEPVWRLGPLHTVSADGEHAVAGARNLDTLRARLSGCMLRRIRREVLHQLPPRTDTQIPITFTEAQEAEHRLLDRPIASLVGRREQRPLTHEEFLRLMSLLTRQRMICNGLALHDFDDVWPSIHEVRGRNPALLDGLSSPKLGELRELVQNLVVEQERKIVVFSQWRRMLRLASWAVEDILSGAGLRGLFFTGGERQRRRVQNIADFHDDPNARILWATDAGGVGLNLQAAASCCINLELPWNPAVLEQRIGRIYRIGQRRSIEVYNLVSEAGIESRIATLVANKRALFTGLFDGTSNEVTFSESGSFLSRLARVTGEPDASDTSDDRIEHDEEIALAAAEPRRQEPVELEGEVPEDGPGVRPSGAGQSRPAPLALVDTPAVKSAGAPAAQLGDLLAQLRVQAGADGGITIHAPPEAAAVLAGLFSGLADSMRAAAEGAAGAQQ
ncbi:MAG: DEAD/DEAH box helicase [Myxococcota bacterium]